MTNIWSFNGMIYVLNKNITEIVMIVYYYITKYELFETML
jgi:hypothetical protein